MRQNVRLASGHGSRTGFLAAAAGLELDDEGAFEVPGDRHVERTSIIARKQELAVTRDGAPRAGADGRL